MPEHIVSSQVIRDVLLPILSDQRDDETLEFVLAVPDETIATRADESGYETEVINESQVARTEAAVTTTLDYFTGVRADLNKPHLARPDRIDETIAHLQAHVTTSNHSH